MKASTINACRKDYEAGLADLVYGSDPLGGTDLPTFVLPMGVTMARGVNEIVSHVSWTSAPDWSDLTTVERRMCRNVHAVLGGSMADVHTIGTKFPQTWTGAWFGLDASLKRYRHTPMPRTIVEAPATRAVKPHTATPPIYGQAHYHVAWLIVAETIRDAGKRKRA